MSGAPLSFLADGGKMGALMRAHDWSKSPLGEPATWPELLKSAVATCLSSRFPMVIWWGPDLIMLYNDAWQPILGETKHPAGLGRPGSESWPETWPIVGKQFESALKGDANWSEDLLLASDRQGFMQECYFTYSHSPLKDAAGTVMGVLTAVIETTPRVLSERRMRALRNLSIATFEGATETETVEQACKRLLALLCSDNPDVPFGVTYLTNVSGQARQIASMNVDAAIFPALTTAAGHDSWGIGGVLRDRKALVTDHSTALSPPLPGGVWPEPTKQLVALPMTLAGRDTNLIGVLVVGVNSRLRLDEPYLDFLKLVAVQLAGSVSTLRSIEMEMLAAQVKEDLISELQLAKEALEEQVQQKELLLKEVNHRVKNSLQIVSSILQLQVPYVSGTEAVGAMRNAASRVLAVATVHERLYRGENVKAVQLDTFLRDLCHEIGRAYGCPGGIEVNVDNIEVPTDMAVPLALIVNELVTNVIKHVGPPCGIVLRANSGGTLKLTIFDQGQGPAEEQQGQGLGSRIVKAFSDQLGATLETKREPTGYVIELTVPLAVT